MGTFRDQKCATDTDEAHRLLRRRELRGKVQLGNGGMRLMILGPPGAGKGTQAGRIAQRLGIRTCRPAMLRAAAQARTKVGEQAKGIMETGGLVPDNIVIRIIAERVEAPDAQSGFILDGFPRTIGQAVELDKMLADQTRSGSQLTRRRGRLIRPHRDARERNG